ncbi:MAG: hypothetical protein ACRD0E_07105, partial [Acidimicrobiales bacterium]
ANWAGESASGAGQVVAMGLRPKLVDRLAAKGIEVPASTFRAAGNGTAPLAGVTGRNGVVRPSRVRVPDSKVLAAKGRGR